MGKQITAPALKRQQWAPKDNAGAEPRVPGSIPSAQVSLPASAGGRTRGDGAANPARDSSTAEMDGSAIPAKIFYEAAVH